MSLLKLATPVCTQTRGVRVFTQTRGVPVSAQTRGVPVLAQTRGVPVSAKTRGVPVLAQTRGVPVFFLAANTTCSALQCMYKYTVAGSPAILHPKDIIFMEGR